jgi:PAS domain S-box-containing protein
MTDESPRAPGSEERYRQILDAAPDAMIVVGRDARIELVNRQTEKLFGYARTELLGARLEILIPERFRAAHSGHVGGFFASAEARPMGSGLELVGRRKDGSEVPIEVSLSPVHTAQGTSVSAAIRDITERKRIEAAVKLNADRFASAVESIHDAFALFDANDRLVLCNSVYRRLVGESTSGALVGKSYEELLDAWLSDLAFPNEEESARFRRERLSLRGEARGAFDVRTRDGRSLRVMDRRTVEGGIVKTIWDLTDDVRLAEEIREARAAAEASSAAKSEFLASMSHELRTPLNGILGFAELLRRDKREPLSARHAERVAQVLKGGEHLLRLIDDILDLSRIEAGGIAISPEPVGVPEVLDEVGATLEAMAARLGIRLEMGSLPPALPMVTADRTRFTQIIMNFGSNAIKYNRPGGTVVFGVSLPDPGHVRVTVADTGVGIALDKQDKLFQPFQRAGQETGPIEGTGIGLVITRRLARLMHGEVGFHSVPAQGSEFWVDLPVHASGARSDAPTRPLKHLTRPKAGAARWLVLYVEDNPANIAFIRDLIEGLGDTDLITAPTAEIGIELARGRLPAAILMDINLPGMSGLEALRVLRAWPETEKIPVIALTAAASERDRQRGEQAGFFRYLTKPVNVDHLEAALDAAFHPG